jgi:glutaredoxin
MKGEIMAKKIELMTNIGNPHRGFCPGCDLMKRLLKKLNVPFVEIYAPPTIRSIPQLYVNGKLVHTGTCTLKQLKNILKIKEK